MSKGTYMAVTIPEHMESWTDFRLKSLQASLPLNFPFAIDIESTNACNLDCFFCPRKEAEKGIGMMDYTLFRRLVDECAERGPIRKIGLHKDGEPLAHPGIVDMVAYIRDQGAAEVISFTSNGILMKPTKAKELIDAGLNDVSFSIDAVEAGTYKRTKGKDKYRLVEENVLGFLAMRPAQVKVTVKFIRMKESQGEEAAFIEKWQDSGADVLVTEYHDWSGSVRDSSLFNLAPSDSFACENPWYALAVNWDGKVSICCVDWDSQGVVGDANFETLFSIWHGEELRRIKELHLRGRSSCVTPCATCTYKNPKAREVIGGWLMANPGQVMGKSAVTAQ